MIQPLTDSSYMELAKKIAISESDDPKVKVDARSGVGAVIVDKNGEVLASANKIPERVKSQIRVEDPNSPHRYHFIEHAERSAIYAATDAGLILRGATMYCTRFPCSDCARAIVAVGIDRLVVAGGFDDDGKWIDAQRAARALLLAANVRIRYV